MAYIHEIINPDFDPKTVDEARDADHLGLHDVNLFDQDERLSDGAYLDEANGQPINNSTETDASLIIGSDLGYIHSRKPSPLGNRNDPAAQWLAEHEQQQAA